MEKRPAADRADGTTVIGRLPQQIGYLVLGAGVDDRRGAFPVNRVVAGVIGQGYRPGGVR